MQYYSRNNKPTRTGEEIEKEDAGRDNVSPSISYTECWLRIVQIVRLVDYGKLSHSQQMKPRYKRTDDTSRVRTCVVDNLYYLEQVEF